MFGLFGSGTPASQSNPPAPTNTPPPSLPSGNSGPASAQQPAQPPAEQARVTLADPPPAQPGPGTGQLTPPAAQSISIADLITAARNPDANGSDDAQQFAAQFMQALGAAEQQGSLANAAQPVQVDQQALYDAFRAVDMTGNLDIPAVLAAINGQTEDGGAGVMQNMMQQVQLNTIMAMTPIVNQLVATAMERASQSAVTQADHNLTSSAIVTAFRDRYEYAASPVVSGMLDGIARTIAQNAPRGTPIHTITDQMHRFFSGMSASLGGGNGQQQPAQRDGLQRDFTGIFR